MLLSFLRRLHVFVLVLFAAGLALAGRHVLLIDVDLPCLRRHLREEMRRVVDQVCASPERRGSS